MRLALTRRWASFRTAIARSGLTEKPVSSQSARTQRSPRNGVHTQEAYQDPQTESEQQEAQEDSQAEGSRPTLFDAQSTEVLLGSSGEADLDTLYVQSCPVTGQLLRTADRQAPLPVIAEEVSWGGDSSTPAAGEEGHGLPSFGTEVSADIDRKGAGTIQDPPIVSRGMLRKESIRASKQLKAEARRQGIDAEKARVKQVLNSRQAADPQSGKSKPLLPKTKRAEQGDTNAIADEQQPVSTPNMLATTAQQAVDESKPQLNDQSSRAKSGSKAKSKGRAKGNGGSSASLKPTPSLPSKALPPPVKPAPRIGSLPGGDMEGKILSYREAEAEDKALARLQAARPLAPPMQQDDDGFEDLISFNNHGSSGLGSTSLPITSASSSARGREIKSKLQSAIQERKAKVRFEAAQSKGEAAYVVAMSEQPAELVVHANPNNIEGALDDPGRKFKFLAPRADERVRRPKEVWKYDLHTSDYMKGELHHTLRPEDAAAAMSLWLHVLHDHLMPWVTIEGGWVTVVTGRGRGRNHASCMARLAVLKEQLRVVADFDAAHDAGAIFVRLRQN